MLSAVGSLCLALGPAQAQAADPAPQAAAASSKVWIGRHAEFEDFLKTAPIVRMQDVGVGVTHPHPFQKQMTHIDRPLFDNVI